jgi:hypothetical protein
MINEYYSLKIGIMFQVKNVKKQRKMEENS